MSSPGERARVSILERLVPSLSFVVAGISGVVGGVMIMQLFERLRASDSAGLGSVFLGLDDVNEVVGAILVVAAVLGAAGVLVCGVRIFSSPNSTASPPGILYVIPALVGLGAPAIVAYISWLMIRALLLPQSEDLGQVGVRVGELSVVAIIVGVISVFDGLLLSFIPFRARLGRKVSPVVFALLLTLATVALAAGFLWMAYFSQQQGNLH